MTDPDEALGLAELAVVMAEMDQACGKEFSISVKMMSGERFEARIRPKWPVQDLKEQIYTNTGLPPQDQALFFEDSKPLISGDLSVLKPNDTISVHQFTGTTSATTSFQETKQQHMQRKDAEHSFLISQADQLSAWYRSRRSQSEKGFPDPGVFLRKLYEDAYVWLATDLTKEVDRIMIDVNPFLGICYRTGALHPVCRRFFNAFEKIGHKASILYALHGTSAEAIPLICHNSFDPKYRGKDITGEYHCTARNLTAALEKAKGSKRVILVAILKGTHCVPSKDGLFYVVNNPPLDQDISFQIPLLVITFQTTSLTLPVQLDADAVCDCAKSEEKELEPVDEDVKEQAKILQSERQSMLRVVEMDRSGRENAVSSPARVHLPRRATKEKIVPTSAIIDIPSLIRSGMDAAKVKPLPSSASPSAEARSSPSLTSFFSSLLPSFSSASPASTASTAASLASDLSAITRERDAIMKSACREFHADYNSERLYQLAEAGKSLLEKSTRIVCQGLKGLSVPHDFFLPQQQDKSLQGICGKARKAQKPFEVAMNHVQSRLRELGSPVQLEILPLRSLESVVQRMADNRAVWNANRARIICEISPTFLKNLFSLFPMQELALVGQKNRLSVERGIPKLVLYLSLKVEWTTPKEFWVVELQVLPTEAGTIQRERKMLSELCTYSLPECCPTCGMSGPVKVITPGGEICRSFREFDALAKNQLQHLVSATTAKEGQLSIQGGRSAIKRAEAEINSLLPLEIPIATEGEQAYWQRLSEPRGSRASRVEEWAKMLEVTVKYVNLPRGSKLVVCGTPSAQGAFHAKYLQASAESRYGDIFSSSTKKEESKQEAKELGPAAKGGSATVYGEATLNIELSNWEEGSAEKEVCKAAILADLCKFYGLTPDRIKIHALMEGSVHFVFSISDVPALGNMTPQELMQQLQEAINIPGGPVYQLPVLQHINAAAGMSAADTEICAKLVANGKAWAQTKAGGKNLTLETNPFLSSGCPSYQRFRNGFQRLGGTENLVDECKFVWHGSSRTAYAGICHSGFDTSLRAGLGQLNGRGEYHTTYMPTAISCNKNSSALLVSAILPAPEPLVRAVGTVYIVDNDLWGNPPNLATEAAYNLPVCVAAWNVNAANQNVGAPVKMIWGQCTCPPPLAPPQVAEIKAVFQPATPGPIQEYHVRMYPEPGSSRVWVEENDEGVTRNTVYNSAALAGAAVLAMFNHKSQTGFNFVSLNNAPYRWQYEVTDQIDGKANGWYDMMVAVPGTQQRIESVYQQWLYLAQAAYVRLSGVPAGNRWNYDISFNEMRQKNTKTNKVRQIRRV